MKKLSAASKYEVKIPNGVAGIRGTVYFITSDGIVSVVAGSVVVAYMGANNQPVTQEVMAGQQFDVKSGQLSPLPPTPIPGSIVVNAQPITYTVDHIIYTVSPTEGNLSGGGGIGSELTSR